MHNMKEEIAARIKEARIAANFKTAGDAATSLGVKYPTYAGHENASRAVDVEDAILYARRFRVSLDWLLTGVGRGPGGSQIEGPIEGDSAILSMLARIPNLSDTDIDVAFGVIKLALARRGGSELAEQNDRPEPATLRHG